MNIENRATKLYIRELAPKQALELLDEYKIPSPYKEVLIVCCVERRKDFNAIDTLESRYNIHLSYRTYVRRLKDSLEMFRKSHTGKF